jgi:DNA-binding CsgD family transcriptional regulator
MADRKFPRSLIRALEGEERFPLRSLEAIREVRVYLEQLEEDALCDSRAMGASISEIADVMQVTRQSVYNKLKSIAERKSEEARQAQEAAVVIPELEEKK